MRLEFDRGGSGSRLLVLLHGMGSTREIWQPMLAVADEVWRGSWLAPDLRGHGRSAHAQSYALGVHAADVAELVSGTGPWPEIVVAGHSMGGAVALALASGWFGIVPRCVFGLGIKVAWSEDKLAQLAKLARIPVRWFDTRELAIERYLRVSGLNGLVAADSPVALAGVVADENGWRLAADPATASVGPPSMADLLAAAHAPIHLGRGETDPMVTREQLLRWDAGAVELAGGGHNAMMQNPRGVWQWIEAELA